MKIVFMGTPIFATAILKSLVESGHTVVGVVSQPDKKTGRKQVVTPTPVHACARTLGIDVYQPASIKEGLKRIREYDPDLIVTCAYGQMIPDAILQYPTFGSLNVHASLLPALRGGAPIHKAIIYGHQESGVSIMRMVAKMDAGAYMLQRRVDIEENDTMIDLHDRLMLCGAHAIVDAIAQLEQGRALFHEQKEEEATYAFAITKEEEYIDCNRNYQEVYNQIRGLISWPVGYIVNQDKKIKIHRARKSTLCKDVAIGTLFHEGKSLYLQCRQGSVELLDVQLEGKAKCTALEFINGAGRAFVQ